MIRSASAFALILFLLSSGNAQKPSSQNLCTHANIEGNQTSDVTFEENKGQVKDQFWNPRYDVLFTGVTQGMNFHIRNKGISYQFLRDDPNNPDSISIYRVDIEWLCSSNETCIEKGVMLGGYSHYYNVAEGTGPALFTRQFASVTQKNLWPGVDLHFYGRRGVLECDWIMAKAEDHKHIRFEVKGAEIRVDQEGYLVMSTPFGEIREGKLQCYQVGHEVQANWKLTGNVVEFDISHYDPQLPLRIDPPVLVWGTYYGGSGNEQTIANCAADALGNVFLAGQTGSGNAIATVGAHQVSLSGYHDAYLIKFDSSGVRQWGTYYGGIGIENGFCAADGLGNCYLAGRTTSASNISTPSAHQTTIGGNYDGYLVKFNSNGVRQWGTYYGGPADEDVRGVTADADGNAFLFGNTESLTGIATPGAHQTTIPGSSNKDAFLIKFDSTGVRQWGTYYGGIGHEYGCACAVDLAGNVFLAGEARSSSAIATPGSAQYLYGGFWDGFLVKFNNSGVRQWGTYKGGDSMDRINGVDLDPQGNIFVAGTTSSSTQIASGNVHQNTLGGNSDAFLGKYNPDGILLWCTYFGGNMNDYGNTCAVDTNGNVYLAGLTVSANGIASPSAHQSVYGGLQCDGYVALFNTYGGHIWGSYYGGSNNDYINSCATGTKGNLYVAGNTLSGNNISTPGAHQPNHGGGSSSNYDAFLARFFNVGTPAQPTEIMGNPTPCPGVTETYHVLNDTLATSYTWSLPVGWSGTSTTNSIAVTTDTTSGTISLTANNAIGSSVPRLLPVTITPIQITSQPASQTIPIGSNIQFTIVVQNSGVNYQWQTNSGAGFQNLANAGQFLGAFTNVLTVMNASLANHNQEFRCAITSGACSVMSNVAVMTIGTQPGIEETKAPADIRIYPNPATDHLFVETAEHVFITDYSIYDCLGRTMMHGSFGSGEKMIDVNHMPQGIYLIRLRGQTEINIRFIRQ